MVGDRVAIMRAGAIEQVGRPVDLYRYPTTPWVATFLGAANVLNGMATNGHASTVAGRIPLAGPMRGPCRVVVRPEHVIVSHGEQGVVSSVEYYGHDTSYEVAVNGTRLVARAIAAPDFVPGDQISVAYSGPDVVAFAAGNRPE